MAQPLHHKEDIQNGDMALDQADFLSSIDLLEAYLHIPIHPFHRKFLRFSYGQFHCQYRALPFGLSTAPRVFTKILVALVANLRSQGVRIFPYLDDILVAASSFSQASKNFSQSYDLPHSTWLHNQQNQTLPHSLSEFNPSRTSNRHQILPSKSFTGMPVQASKSSPSGKSSFLPPI